MPFIPHVLESWSWPREGEAVVQSILLGAAKACSSQEHWEKGSNRPFFLRRSRNKEENRKNSCSQYLYSTLDSPEEIKGGKITFQSEDTTFPQSKLLTAPSSSLGSGYPHVRPGKMDTQLNTSQNTTGTPQVPGEPVWLWQGHR